MKAGLQVVAALDGCHVPVIVPLQSPEDYVLKRIPGSNIAGIG